MAITYYLTVDSCSRQVRKSRMGSNVSAQQQQVVQPMKEHCIVYHSLESQGGLDYPWLVPSFGRLIRAEFNEGDMGWIDYSQLHRSSPDGPIHNWWMEHCRAVSHDVNNLAANHIAIFVSPETRSIIMRFTFENGTAYRSDVDLDTFKLFFHLEEEYARALIAQR